ncbi:hypothetical protein [Vibrio marisflavi]|nr:hypothetical protein [Vibrio marisflavi]
MNFRQFSHEILIKPEDLGLAEYSSTTYVMELVSEFLKQHNQSLNDICGFEVKLKKLSIDFRVMPDAPIALDITITDLSKEANTIKFQAEGRAEGTIYAVTNAELAFYQQGQIATLSDEITSLFGC